MASKAQKYLLISAGLSALLALVLWWCISSSQGSSIALEPSGVASPAVNQRGKVVLVAAHSSSKPNGPCEFYHDGVLNGLPAILRIPGVGRFESPLVLLWSRECTVRDHWAFGGFVTKFNLSVRHYVALPDGRSCVRLYEGESFPSSRSSSPVAGRPRMSFDVKVAGGQLSFRSGDVSLSLDELTALVRSGARPDLSQGLDLYLDENLPLIMLKDLEGRLKSITQNLRLLRDNGYHSSCVHVDETSIVSLAELNVLRR